jgi:hypothetical protein
MLQRHTNDKTSSPIANFGCPLCHAKYAITRRPTSPGIIPVCEECDQEFVSREDGEWLLYDPVSIDQGGGKLAGHQRSQGSGGGSDGIHSGLTSTMARITIQAKSPM